MARWKLELIERLHVKVILITFCQRQKLAARRKKNVLTWMTEWTRDDGESSRNVFIKSHAANCDFINKQSRCVFCFRRSKIELKIPFSDTHRDMVYDTCLMAFLLFAFAWAAKSLANLAIYEFKIPLDFMGDSGDFASSSCHWPSAKRHDFAC